MRSSVPNMLTRRRNIVDMMIPTKPNVLRHRIRAHKTLDGAFSSSQVIFEVERGAHFVSPTLQKKGLGAYEDSKRGQTRITFDPEDYKSSLVPGDDEVIYLRVEDYDVALGGYLAPGSILILPPEEYFGVQDSMLTLTGSAPGISATRGESAPTGALSFSLPLFSSSALVQNLDGSNTLLVAFGRGMAMSPVPNNGNFTLVDGSVVEIFAASENGSAVDFTMVFSLTKV